MYFGNFGQSDHFFGGFICLLILAALVVGAYRTYRGRRKLGNHNRIILLALGALMGIPIAWGIALNLDWYLFKQEVEAGSIYLLLLLAIVAGPIAVVLGSRVVYKGTTTERTHYSLLSVFLLTLGYFFFFTATLPWGFSQTVYQNETVLVIATGWLAIVNYLVITAIAMYRKRKELRERYA